MSHSFRLRRAILFLGPITALLLLLAGIIAYKMPANAHGAGAKTLYVGHTIGNDTGCSSPGYTSVQAAVDAANPGDVVYLCGTTPYAEQVIITKSITLTGDHGATIAAPNPFPSTSPSRLPPQFTNDNLFVPQAIVFVWGAGVNVNIKNLIVTGPLPGNGGCANDEFGVLVIDGAKATLTGDTVSNIKDINSALYGCQFGVAIQVGREYWPTANFSTYVTEDFVGHAIIKNTTVFSYQKNGITVDGPGSTADISGGTISGFGQTNVIAQNGIQISRGAFAQVEGTTVKGNQYTGTGGASSTGILVYGGSCDGPATPLTVKTKILNDTLQNNDIGIALFNAILDGNNDCSLPTTPTSILASENHITDSVVSNVSGTNLFNYPGGYQAGISDEGYGDKMNGNRICGVGYTPIPNPPPYLSNIDVAATNPIVENNKSCNSKQSASASAQTKTSSRLHSSARPAK